MTYWNAIGESYQDLSTQESAFRRISFTATNC